MLSSNTPVRKGGRRRSFRISARPRGLCATLLWREVLIRKLPLNITDFSKRIGVPRTTVLCVFKQLDDYKNFPPSKELIFRESLLEHSQLSTSLNSALIKDSSSNKFLLA